MANDLRSVVETKVGSINQEVNRRGSKLEKDIKAFQDKIDKGLLTRSVAEVQSNDLQKRQNDFQQYAAKTDKSDRAATISLIDCTKLDPVAEICRTLFPKYATGLEEMDAYVVQRYYRYQKHWFYDLEDVLVHAGMDETEHNSLKSALNGCILYKAATEEFLKGYGGFTIRTYCGFSMYLPSMGSAFLDSHYKDLAWNKATGLVD